MSSRLGPRQKTLLRVRQVKYTQSLTHSSTSGSNTSCGMLNFLGTLQKFGPAYYVVSLQTKGCKNHCQRNILAVCNHLSAVGQIIMGSASNVEANHTTKEGRVKLRAFQE